MHARLKILMLVIASVTNAALGSTPDDGSASNEEIGALVEALDADRFATREDATEKLLVVGMQAVDQLSTAVQGESLEAADRAVWVLVQFSKSEDRALQLAALDALTSARQFPGTQNDARTRLAALHETLCREQFQQLGALLTIEHPVTATDGVVTRAKIELGAEWSGTAEAFHSLNNLQSLYEVSIWGEGLTEDALACCADLRGLRRLRVQGISVKPATVQALKQANPNLRVQISHRSALGVRYIDTESHVISDVPVNSPAAKAGLEPGDVITHFNGETVPNFDLLTAHVSQYEPGDEVHLKVQRGEAELDARVRLGLRSELDTAPRR